MSAIHEIKSFAAGNPRFGVIPRGDDIEMINTHHFTIRNMQNERQGKTFKIQYFSKNDDRARIIMNALLAQHGTSDILLRFFNAFFWHFIEVAT